jgi:putative CocE/NonD family hydrolase
VKYDGTSLGVLKFDGDTALQYRREVLRPFFDQYLKDGAPKANTPPVLIYNTGENHWESFKSWPLACDSGCKYKPQPLYLAQHGGLSFERPATAGGASAYDEYVSDPAKPVPYIPRPVLQSDRSAWQQWLVSDQRPASDRTDVLTYETEPLKEPLKISGASVVNLVASTSGSDSDWVVKLIDVYPDRVPGEPAMGGFELGVAMDIFRGRYREGFAVAKPIASNQPLAYKFALPTANHTFLPGHRIMVQVQSSWFPLYDRNPQTFVPNVFFAKPGDYVKATQRVFHAQDLASFISLPVVPAEERGVGRQSRLAE